MHRRPCRRQTRGLSFRPTLAAGLASLLVWLVGAPAAASQSVLYVDADALPEGDGSAWETALADLQDALLAAGPGDRIHVAQGTYKPSAEREPGDGRSATFALVEGVALLGGFAGAGETDPDLRDPLLQPTVLSGDLGIPGVAFDNAYHVVWSEELSGATVLDGVTLRDGRATGFDVADGTSGGGLFNRAADPTLRGCVFTENEATNGCGGGMYNAGGSPVLRDCEFLFNQTLNGNGAGFANAGGDPLLEDCLFFANSVENGALGGGGMSNEGGSATLRDCVFEFNFGGLAGGAVVNSEATPAFLDCVFRGNGACRGGAVSSEGGAGHYQGCLFVENIAGCFFFAGTGGAVAGTDADDLFVNCRFVANGATEATEVGSRGGAVATVDGRARFTNCVMTGNTCHSAAVTSREGGFGAAIHATGTELLLAQCTLTANRAETTDGGLFGSLGGGVYGGLTTIRNSILWGNVDSSGNGQSAQVNAGAEGSLDVSDSCIEGLDEALADAGNIAEDPLFVDAAGADLTPGSEDDDLRLGALSPCVDAGDDGAVPADEGDLDCDGDLEEPTSLDLSGTTRFAVEQLVEPNGVERGARAGRSAKGDPGVVDMGAFERSRWTRLGAELAGGVGEPCMVGRGGLEPGSEVRLSLTRSIAHARVVLFVGQGVSNTPWKGGLLVPTRELVFPGLMTGPGGTLELVETWPEGLPSGFELFYQFWVQDPAAVFAVAASNAIGSETR